MMFYLPSIAFVCLLWSDKRLWSKTLLNGSLKALFGIYCLPIANIWRLCEKEFWRWGLRPLRGVWVWGGYVTIKNAIPF